MWDKRKKELVMEIIAAALEVNGDGERKRESTGMLPTAFVDFSGHISQISVKIYAMGWESSGRAASADFSVYIEDLTEDVAARIIEIIRAFIPREEAASQDDLETEGPKS